MGNVFEVSLYNASGHSQFNMGQIDAMLAGNDGKVSTTCRLVQQCTSRTEPAADTKR